MPKRDYLVRLIQAMDAAEKKNFLSFAKDSGSDKQYLKLYHMLEGEQQYDAKTLCKKLNVQPKQLADDKYYLNKLLLKSLRSFDDPEWKHTRLLKDFHDAKILTDRGMHEDALIAIDKIIKEATYLEMYGFVLYVYSLKRICLWALLRYDEMGSLEDERRRIVAAYEEATDMWELNSYCYRMTRMGGKDTELDKILKHPLLKRNPGEMLSVQAVSHWYGIKRRTCDERDMDEQLKLDREQMTFYVAHPQVRDVQAGAYVFGYINSALRECTHGGYDRAHSLLVQVESELRTPSKYLDRHAILRAKFSISVLYCHIARKTGKYDEACLWGERAYQSEYQKSAYDLHDMTWEWGVALVHAGRSKEAYEKLDELVMMKEDIRIDLQPYIRSLMIMTQIDMGHYDVAVYLIKSSKVWMKRRKITSPDADQFFSYAYAIANAPTLARKDALLKLKQAIKAGKLNSIDNEIDLGNWTERKLKGKGASAK